MSNGVEFEGDKFSLGNQRPQFNQAGMGANSGEPKMVRWLMNKGIVKSANIGQLVLIGVIIFNIIITYIIVKFIL